MHGPTSGFWKSGPLKSWRWIFANCNGSQAPLTKKATTEIAALKVLIHMVRRSEGRLCEEYTSGYYGLCAVGGMLSAGTTHLVTTPLDVLKVNMQVFWKLLLFLFLLLARLALFLFWVVFVSVILFISQSLLFVVVMFWSLTFVDCCQVLAFIMHVWLISIVLHSLCLNFPVTASVFLL